MASNTVMNPRWGIFDLILVYVLIVVLTLLLSPILLGNLDDLSFFILGALLQILITVLVLGLIVVFKNKASFSDLGVRTASSRDYMYYGLLGGVFLMILMILLGIPISRIHSDVQPQLYEEMLRSAGGMQNFVKLFILGAILAPFSEELLYRGMLYPVFRRYLGPTWGIMGAGLIFGLAHWDLWRTIPLAVGGALLCYIYEKTGSILVTTLAHGVWNGLMSLLVYYAVVSTV